jgi:transposase-like protein
MLDNHEACLTYLEKIRWEGTPTCPYCGSNRSSKYKNEHRYRCGSCFTSYSVTVGTLFHNTHLNLQKWFAAIVLLRYSRPGISVRRLAQEIGVNKSTALLMTTRIRNATGEDIVILKAIVRVLWKIV